MVTLSFSQNGSERLRISVCYGQQVLCQGDWSWLDFGFMPWSARTGAPVSFAADAEEWARSLPGAYAGTPLSVRVLSDSGPVSSAGVPVAPGRPPGFAAPQAGVSAPGGQWSHPPGHAPSRRRRRRLAIAGALSPALIAAALALLGSSGYTANWAGYVASGSAISSVQASWTVPAVSCAASAGPSDSVMWAGVDDGPDDLMQTGTEGLCTSPDEPASYYAWWESLPAMMTRGQQISPGDRITATVYTDSQTPSIEHIVLVDNGQTIIDQTLPASAMSRNEAECIVEKPEHPQSLFDVPLADFGSATFTGCAVSTQAGADNAQLGAGSVPGLSVQRATLLASPGADVEPSSADGSTWTVRWHAGT